MKLWILRPREGLSEGDNHWDPWYDKAFGFVVRAETEIDARQIAQNKTWSESNTVSAWNDSKYSTCKELTSDGQAGMIIHDIAQS
jgi:hypothetical protein